MVMNLPNILTLSRIVLAIVLIFLLESKSSIGNGLAVIVFALGALTDFYDGHLAKTKGLVSDFGKIMDPIADKFLMLAVFGVLAHIGSIAWWMFALIATREIIVTASRLWMTRQGRIIAAERSGKIKTVVQIVAILMILFYLTAQQALGAIPWFRDIQGLWHTVDNMLMFAVVFLTLYSGWDYFCKTKG